MNQVRVCVSDGEDVVLPCRAGTWEAGLGSHAGVSGAD